MQRTPPVGSNSYSSYSYSYSYSYRQQDVISCGKRPDKGRALHISEFHEFPRHFLEYLVTRLLLGMAFNAHGR